MVLKFPQELNKSQLANGENLVRNQVRADLYFNDPVTLVRTAYVIDFKSNY